MPNLSPTARRRVSLCAAGAGAALFGLLVSPLAHADDSFLPTGAAAGDYNDLSAMYEAVLAFENSNGLAEDAFFFSDLTSSGNLLTDFLSATALDVGDPFPAGATASDDVSAIAAENTTLTGQLAGLEQDISAIDAASANLNIAGTDINEYDVLVSTSAFLTQIDNSLDSLSTITAQDETSPVLISYLSALYDNDINMGNNLANLGDALTIGDPAGITQDNAAILSEALGMANEVQSTADTLTILADLSSLGL